MLDRVEVLRTLASLEALRPAWCALAARVPHALPFQTAAWNITWWRHFSVRNAFRCDQPLVFACYAGDMLVGVLPILASDFGLLGLRLMRYERPFGADHNLTEIRAPLVLEEHADAMWRHVLDFSQQSGLRPQLNQVVAPRAQLHPALQADPGVHWLTERELTTFVLEPGDDWARFKSGLKRNIKESLRRCYNSLTREGWCAQLVVLIDGQAIREALPAFYVQHRERAQADGEVSHPDYFADPRARNFIEDLSGHFAGDGAQMLMFCLRVNGENVAMRLAFRVGGELYLYYSGYAQRYAKYSVMTTLVAEIIQWAIAHQVERINLSKGRDVSKTRWGPREVRYLEANYVRNSLPARCMGALTMWARQRRKPP